MANGFSKEIRVAFEDLLEKFNDQLVLSRLVNKYRTNQESMERSNDVIWRPMPYIMPSFDGLDQTANFTDNVQLSVPSTIGFKKSVPWALTATELRDALQENRLGGGAAQKLASDVNRAINDVVSLQGTLVVKRTAAASGFDDIAQMDAIMNEQGVMNDRRYFALSTRDYNSAASNLAKPQTSPGAKALTAYEQAWIGRVGGFDGFKMDYTPRVTAAAGGAITISGNQSYTPVATTSTTGGLVNVDNRYQTLTVSSTAGVVAGDCFTIQGVNAVHHITKQDTGQLKTFRVISVTNGTQMVISPPIISNTTPTPAGERYKNVTAQAANTAPITWLNTAAAFANPFWQGDSIEILPGRYVVPANSGVDVMRGTTENGIELTMTKQFDIKTYKENYRFDILFGVVNTNPEMNGIILFNQV